MLSLFFITEQIELSVMLFRFLLFAKSLHILHSVKLLKVKSKKIVKQQKNYSSPTGSFHRHTDITFYDKDKDLVK